MSQLTDGATIEIHPAFHFPQDIWLAMTQADKDYVITARQNFRNNRNTQQVTVEIPIDAMSQISQLSGTTNTTNIGANNNASIAQVTTNPPNTTATISLRGIMGGRNSQNKRARHS